MVDSGSVSGTERFGVLFEAVLRGLDVLFSERLLGFEYQMDELSLRKTIFSGSSGRSLCG
jgi:hypothetical protein